VWGGGDHLCGGDQLDTAACSHGALQADLEIYDLDLVLNERPAGFAVLAAPFRIPKFSPIPFPE
jgi:hypothetical protein